MRIAVILVVVAVFCGAAYYVLTHSNHEQLERLTRELAVLEAQNQELERQNTDLERRIVALRDDPRLAERQAREMAGLARPDELVFQFEEPAKAVEVRVRLRVRKDSIELAGRNTELEELSQGLERVYEEVTGARLLVLFDEDVDILRRQHVIDIVDASPLAPATFRE